MQRKILETLTRERLWEILDHFEIEASDRRSTEAMLGTILQVWDTVDLGEVLNWLTRVELQNICTALGLGVGGREKEGYRTAILEHVRAKLSARRTSGQAQPDEDEDEPEEATIERKSTERGGRRVVRTQERSTERKPAEVPSVSASSSGKSSSGGVGVEKSSAENKVFIVHGHDDAMRLEIKQFIERLQLRPIVLQDEASKGQTVLEKLERYRDQANYAVVLLSPDDVGYSKRDGEKAAKPRARQNVVLELGMMLGALGRGRVAVLHQGDVELPSDIHGLVYIAYLSAHIESANLKLAKELRAAGFNVDLNHVLA